VILECSNLLLEYSITRKKQEKSEYRALDTRYILNLLMRNVYVTYATMYSLLINKCVHVTSSWPDNFRIPILWLGFFFFAEKILLCLFLFLYHSYPPVFSKVQCALKLQIFIVLIIQLQIDVQTWRFQS